METAISQVSFVASKKDATNYANSIIESVKEGLTDPIQVQKTLKYVELVCKTVKESIEENVLKEAFTYHKEELKEKGIQIAESGVAYDYSKCNDDVLNDLESKLAEYEKLVKDRKEFLKGIPETGEVYNELGVKISRPAKESKTIVKFTLK